MPAVTPRDGDPLLSGYIYVAPPNRHLELSPEGIRCTHGPRINGARPSIDVLFKTAAAMCGPHVVGVLLSGGLDDGSSGLAAISRAGGVTIVQDPEEALIPSMPRTAIAMAAPSHVDDMP